MLDTHDAKGRENWYARIGGTEGAAFITCVLIELQAAPVDVCNYFTNYGGFGLFTQYGVPKKTYYSMKAFNELLKTPVRLLAEGGMKNICSVAAGTNEDRSEITVLTGNLRNNEPKTTVILNAVPWEGQADFELDMMDEMHEFGKTGSGSVTIVNHTMRFELEKPGTSVMLLKFRRHEP